MNIRVAIEADSEAIWPIFHEIASAGETYAYPRDISKEEAKSSGCTGPAAPMWQPKKAKYLAPIT
jgi:hypothetical protein